MNAIGTQLRDPINSGLRACKMGEPTQGGREPNHPRETKILGRRERGQELEDTLFCRFCIVLFCFVFVLQPELCL